MNAYRIKLNPTTTVVLVPSEDLRLTIDHGINIEPLDEPADALAARFRKDCGVTVEEIVLGRDFADELQVALGKIAFLRQAISVA